MTGAESMIPDTQAIEAAIAKEVKERNNLGLLVAHSYESVPASCAIERLADSGMVRVLIVAV